MRRNVKEELRQSMDALRFSDKDKEEMTNMLLKNSQNQSHRRGGRKLLVVALAAAMALVTMTAAGVYTQWSRSANTNYPLTEQQKQTAEKSGLSVMLEETKATENTTKAPTEKAPVISATDKGITITAQQTMVDKYRAYLVFRIEGFDLPEGECPSIEGGVVSINGKEPRVGSRASFYAGYAPQRDGTVTYADGTPIQHDANGEGICRHVGADGSLEYDIDLFFPTEGYEGYKEHLGSEIVVKFTNIGISDGLEHVPMVDGDWTLKWTLTGTEESRTVEPNAPIGDTGFILRSAELTPTSCILTMEGDATTRINPYTNEPQDYWIPQLKGVLLKDGSYVPAPMNGGGSKDLGNNLHWENSSLLAPDLDDVKSLVFWGAKEPYDGSEHIVPIG